MTEVEMDVLPRALVEIVPDVTVHNRTGQTIRVTVAIPGPLTEGVSDQQPPDSGDAAPGQSEAEHGSGTDKLPDAGR